METNILLLDAAREALGRVQQTMRLSRDATVRALLAEHVAEQERRARVDPRRPLTHISTVLRYPLRPWNPKDPFPASPLRVRIDEDLERRARAVGLRLPGQTRRRGGRDYQPRPLADAIVTAIARTAPPARRRTPQRSGWPSPARGPLRDRAPWPVGEAVTGTTFPVRGGRTGRRHRPRRAW